jgi:hypothetical protein
MGRAALVGHPANGRRRRYSSRQDQIESVRGSACPL